MKKERLLWERPPFYPVKGLSAIKDSLLTFCIEQNFKMASCGSGLANGGSPLGFSALAPNLN